MGGKLVNSLLCQDYLLTLTYHPDRAVGYIKTDSLRRVRPVVGTVSRIIDWNTGEEAVTGPRALGT